MSLILNIDTASEKAHISFAKNGLVIDSLSNELQKEHAGFLQSAIQQSLKNTGINIKDINAVAVTTGPGSYTGLRVGMASAKGLCFALKKPLISLGTLEVLTASALHLFQYNKEPILFCPMIDARRMEVFTGIYEKSLAVHTAPFAMILEESSFGNELAKNKILFFGTGSGKWKLISKHPNAIFETVSVLPESMSNYSNILFSENKFADLAYCEPFYLKEFQTVSKI